MILVVAPNHVRMRHFIQMTPTAGNRFGISAADVNAHHRVRGIQAEAIIFTDADLGMRPELGFWLQECFSNMFDLKQSRKIRDLIAGKTVGGSKAIQKYFNEYRKRAL